MYNNNITNTIFFYKAVEETRRNPGFVDFLFCLLSPKNWG